MIENFDNSVQYVLNDEGGYAERINEPGGAVNHGISFQLFLEVWHKDPVFRFQFYQGKTDEPTFADLKALTDKGASYIYEHHIFPLVGFDKMPVGLDYVMVNTATMQGAHGAIDLLQQSLNVPVTGHLDKVTLDALAKAPMIPVPLAGVLIQQASAKMHDKRVGDWVDPTGKKMNGFGPGWANRMIRVFNRAVGMINK